MSKRKKKVPYLDEYLPTYVASRGIVLGSMRQIKYAINAFDRWRGERTRLSDLTEDMVNLFVAEYGADKKPKYILKQRNDILGLWRQAVRQRILENPPNPYWITQIKLERKIPKAWTIEEMREMLTASSTWPGRYRDGTLKRDWWGMYLRAKWDSGFRDCDLFNLPTSSMDNDGHITIIQQKTGYPVTRAFHPGTLARIFELTSGDVLIQYSLNESTFRDHFLELCEICNLKGYPNTIRKSAASYVAREHPGSAGRFLGHCGCGEGEIAGRYYIDPTIANGAPVMPPPLDDSNPAAQAGWDNNTILVM